VNCQWRGGQFGEKLFFGWITRGSRVRGGNSISRSGGKLNGAGYSCAAPGANDVIAQSTCL
jgi:hypothetical protein